MHIEIGRTEIEIGLHGTFFAETPRRRLWVNLRDVWAGGPYQRQQTEIGAQWVQWRGVLLTYAGPKARQEEEQLEREKARLRRQEPVVAVGPVAKFFRARLVTESRPAEPV